MLADQLTLYCQPTVSAGSGDVVGAEALVRWRHPKRGIIAPGEWVPTIERSVLRRRFNLHVLALAANHQSAWRSRGLHLPLSVNITPAVLSDETFIRAVERMFSDRPNDGLCLEITERTTTINSPDLQTNIERLAELGFAFHLDDFGVGYSSLHRLANLPFSTLKIDGSLCADLCHDRTHRAIVRSVARLARELRLEVTCEGVEDQATWRVIQALGADRIQGYYIARPMPAEHFPAFVDSYLPDPPQPDDQAREPRWTKSTERRTGRDRRARLTEVGA